jgi:hypothetical protein
LNVDLILAGGGSNNPWTTRSSQLFFNVMDSSAKVEKEIN